MKFEIRNRWNGAVQFECKLSAEIAGNSFGFQLGFAVREARKSGADLRDAVLRGADLRGVDLRGVDLNGAVLGGAVLRGADLRGVVLSGADLRGVDLNGAVLGGAVLRGADLRGVVLSGADLRGADLRDADLRDAVLRDADLRGAVLRDADLSGAVLSGAVLRDAVLRDADLSGAVLSGVPVIPDIHQTVHAAASQANALDMETWHSCETTHCRAGWVVTLAGDAGRAMEFCMGTPAAAALIYMASDPKLDRIPNFYATNADALADMKRLAKAEAGGA